MPIPERYLRLFQPELASGEQVRAVANADLWLRYRRLALTDRRLLIVERGGVRHPIGGRRVVSVPIADIECFAARRSSIQWTVAVGADGARYSYALPTISKGSARFVAALRQALAGRVPS